MGYQPATLAGQTAEQVTAAAQKAASDAVNAQVPALLLAKATSRRVWSQMSVQTGDTVNAATTNEQPFTSRGQIPGPLVVGEVLRLHGGGTFTTSSLLTPTQRARIRWGVGGPVLMDTGNLAPLIGAAAGRYLFDVSLIVRSIGTSGTVEAYGSIKYANALFGTTEALCGPSGVFSDAGNPVTVDTTQLLDLPLSVTFSATTATTTNTNTLRWSVLHDLKPVT